MELHEASKLLRSCQRRRELAGDERLAGARWAVQDDLTLVLQQLDELVDEAAIREVAVVHHRFERVVTSSPLVVADPEREPPLPSRIIRKELLEEGTELVVRLNLPGSASEHDIREVFAERSQQRQLPVLTTE